MDDIGSTDDTALLCHTNQPSRRDSEGDWFAPNGTKVGNYTDSTPRDVHGFGRNRGPHLVRLKRSSDGTPVEGVYKCVVRDTTDTNQTVYVSREISLGSSLHRASTDALITGASVIEATIPNLMLSTKYSIQIAAVNNAGTGVFSNATIIKSVE